MPSILENVPLAPYTTFKIGGQARFFITVTSEAELVLALDYAQNHSLPFHILAGGSNTLVADEGYNGLVIHIDLQQKVSFGSTRTLGAGRVLWDEIRAASSEGLGGWESLAGIPGSIGGAIRGNAGAFGVEMKDVVTTVIALHTETRERRIFTNAECEFDYRDSFFKQNPAWVVLSCDVDLRELPVVDSVAKADETVREREKRHLQNVACAGSFFMNPVAPQWVVDQFEEEKKAVSRAGRVPAGWLIEKVGMKGEKEGGAQASPMHPNYLMNTGTATARDVLTLAERIRTKIANDYMTHMFEEVTKVGL